MWNYKFSNLCGSPYRQGNILFSPDGNKLYSPIGNRVAQFDLSSNLSSTLPFESRRNIRALAIDPLSGKILIIVDVDGRALVTNVATKKVLYRINFKKEVRFLTFSPCSQFLAVCTEKRVQVWKFHVSTVDTRTNHITLDFSKPLNLYKTYFGHKNRVNYISWFFNSRFFLTASTDGSAKLYCLDEAVEAGCETVTLAGHKSKVVSVFFLPRNKFGIQVEDLGKPESWEIWVVSETGKIVTYEWLSESLQSGSEEEFPKDSKDSDLSEDISDWSLYKGNWKVKAKHDLYRSHTKISASALQGYNPCKLLKTSTEKLQKYLSSSFAYLVVAYDKGSFCLFETESMKLIQELSLSKFQINSVTLSSSSEWIGLGCRDLGQIAVWEWRSETFVLKQQGHFYNVINTSAFSPNGNLIATGGDDSKIKVWSTRTGFSFVTFTDHEGPVTDLVFSSKGNVIVSSSLDGTVRAFDLVRYRNFRILTSPDDNVQFTCCQMDANAEIVCAGSNSTARVYVWRLQTGKILVVLNGHEAPITKLSCFGSLLASSSLDKSLRLWDVYSSKSERVEVGVEVLCTQVRADGKQVCCSGLNGNLYFFNTESALEESVIEGRRDIVGGRKVTDRRTVSSTSAIHCFSAVSYSADGKRILAGGRSKYVCLYDIKSRVLLRKFQITCNRSFDGVLDKLNSKNLLQNGALDEMDVSDNDSDVEEFEKRFAWNLKGGDITQRSKLAEIRVKDVQFSPTNEQFTVCSTEGLLVYKLNRALSLDSLNVAESVNPLTVLDLVRSGNVVEAYKVALHLGEIALIKSVLDTLQKSNLKEIVLMHPKQYLLLTLTCIASKLSTSPRIEFYFEFVERFLSVHSLEIREKSVAYIPIIRDIHNAFVRKEKTLGVLCSKNVESLGFLIE